MMATSLPSFDGPLSLYGSTTTYMPLKDVEVQIQCELYDFVNDEDTRSIANSLLDAEQPATVTFSYQSEVDGKASFIGIDLNRIGLTQIATLVSTTNKIPSLQASVQTKGSVSDADIFKLPQVNKDLKVVDVDVGGKKIQQVRQYFANPSDTTTHPKIRGLWNIGEICEGRYSGWPREFGIKGWLKGKFDQNFTKIEHGLESRPPTYVYGADPSVACHDQIKLKTQLVMIFDISAGVNPLFASTYILPISGFTGDVSPQFQSSLEIDFMVKNRENNELCSQLVNRKGLVASVAK
jgi:hypothetical protein